MLIAVYGSLRKGFYNHSIIEDSVYLGRFDSLPEYNMYDLGSYPGLTKNGETSIVLEVYRVDQKILSNVDRLEGYNILNEDRSHYIRNIIDTPYGNAYIYIYAHSVTGYPQVIEGDWEECSKEKKYNLWKTILDQKLEADTHLIYH